MKTTFGFFYLMELNVMELRVYTKRVKIICSFSVNLFTAEE